MTKNFILKLIIYIAAFWIIYHLFAFIGIFVSGIYLLLWFIIPQKLPCFYCCLGRKRRNFYCIFCESKTGVRKGLYPKNLNSAIKNTALLILLTVLSAFLVVIESKILFNIKLFEKESRISFSVPPREQYKIDEVFPMEIKIENISEPVNAVQVDLRYDTDSLEVVSISEKGSFAKIFLEKSIYREAGTIRFSGGLPNPGYSESEGLFGTVSFRGKKTGLSNVNFLPGSMVLANDGKGTNVLELTEGVAFFILPVHLSREEERDQVESLTPAVLGAEDFRDPDKLYLYDTPGVMGADSAGDAAVSGNIFTELFNVAERPVNLLLRTIRSYDAFVIGRLRAMISIFYVG